MSIIKESLINTGVTTYKIDIEAVKTLVAKDLGVPPGAVQIEATYVTVGTSRMDDGYEEFAGLKIHVDNSKIPEEFWRK